MCGACACDQLTSRPLGMHCVPRFLCGRCMFECGACACDRALSVHLAGMFVMSGGTTSHEVYDCGV